jgi:hypothetical protein
MNSRELAEIDQLVSDIIHEALQAYRQSLAEASNDAKLELIAKYGPTLRTLCRMARQQRRRTASDGIETK